MTNIFPIDFEEKLTMAQDDYILFSDSEDGNKIKKAQYKNLKGEKGDPGTPGADGNDGAAATITVGSTTTGTPGSSASVTNSGTSSAAVLDFTIPQGAKGEPGVDGQDGVDGAAATITVGTTTTLPAGSSATVTNVGTSQDAILNFGIPKGDAGTGSGDVNGPASSTDGHLAVFDGATGKLIKDGGSVPTGVPSGGTDGQVLSKVSGSVAWANPTGGAEIEYKTQAEYNALLPGAASDGKHYFIYSTSGGGGGWQPGANTLLYMPLDSTNTNSDVLGHTTTIGGTVRFGTYGGIDCADLTSRGNINITPFALGNSYTILARVNNVNGVYESGGRIVDLGSPRVGIAYRSPEGYYTYENNDYFGVTTQNAWFLTAVVVTGSTGVGYLKGNGVDDTSALVSCFNSGTPTAFNIGNEYNNSADRYFLGYISNVIVEDKARTAQEISDYYDQTKGNYGIS